MGIDLANIGKPVTCNLQPFPFRLWSASGGIIDGTPIICGGLRMGPNPDACYIYEQGKWTEDKVISLSTPRGNSGSVVINNKLIMVGGIRGDGRRDFYQTIEVV